MRIGLFGGTFNPIHLCHLTIATQVRDRLALDLVLFIPTGDPPHKPRQALAPAQHRLEMVRLAIGSTASFSVSDVEVRRPTTSYSIDTVKALREEYGQQSELFFIVGLDAFLEFPGWRQAVDLLTLCHFAVTSRSGIPFGRLADLASLPPIPRRDLDALDRRAKDRVDVPLPGGHSLTLLQLPPCDISASDIRKRLHDRLSVSALLPAPVESYIMRLRLYQEEADRPGVEG